MDESTNYPYYYYKFTITIHACSFLLYYITFGHLIIAPVGLHLAKKWYRLVGPYECLLVIVPTPSHDRADSRYHICLRSVASVLDSVS